MDKKWNYFESLFENEYKIVEVDNVGLVIKAGPDHINQNVGIQYNGNSQRNFLKHCSFLPRLCR